MALVVGVTFRQRCKPYWFDPSGLSLERGVRVVVETVRGLEIGTVRMGVTEVPDDQLTPPVKPVLRLATEEDERQAERNRKRAADALRQAEDRVQHFHLPMKLVGAEYSLDGNQITIYFTAENRVDFRELVRDLACRLRTRVQLHQIGARDHTRLAGGYGTCGRELCCRTFLADFAPVSMRMAKDQSLFLNPVKFSGVCGKLMCCLRFEHEMYTAARCSMPAVGSTVVTPHGEGEVVALSVIRNEVTVILNETSAQLTIRVDDITTPPSSPASP